MKNLLKILSLVLILSLINSCKIDQKATLFNKLFKTEIGNNKNYELFENEQISIEYKLDNTDEKSKSKSIIIV